jgi:hypothetical protein
MEEGYAAKVFVGPDSIVRAIDHAKCWLDTERQLVRLPRFVESGAWFSHT